MASPSRSPSRGRAPARSSSSSGGNQQTMVLGGIAVAVVVVLLVIMNGGKSSTAKTDASTPPAAKLTPAAAPMASSPAKAGKTPAKPAPALTAEMLGKIDELLAKAKSFYNEGSAARTAGDNKKAREKQGEAKALIDQIQQLVSAQADWQMEAEMGNWAQSADYATLAKTYGAVMNLANLIRKGGG